MNIRKRIGLLENTVGRRRPLQELSEAELEAIIRKGAGLGDGEELTDDLLYRLSMERTSAE